MTWQGRRRVVDETILLAWWRDRMENDPVHQNRIRQTTNQPNRSK